MPAERVAMRQVREILRLTFSSKIPGREIARRLGIAPSTVRETVKRFQTAGLAWPLADQGSERRLQLLASVVRWHAHRTSLSAGVDEHRDRQGPVDRRRM